MTFRDTVQRFIQLLNVAHPPISIRFERKTASQPRLGRAMPPATPDGRTGAVPAGCVFWVESMQRAFSTTPDDHANCSVGSLTHGLLTLEEACTKSDVKALIEAGWVTPAAFPSLPVVRERYPFITYGPLSEQVDAPDVVLARINAKQAMLVSDAVPGVRFEGKPQCHVVALAKESGVVAISVGCMLSRVRTGMSSSEMTLALPGARLDEVVELVGLARPANEVVAAYAAADKARFATSES